MKLQEKNTLDSELVQSGLRGVNEIILEKIASNAELVTIISDYLISAGGKRIRPIITIVAAHMCGYSKGDDHIKLAASIEFIHTATLLHDDVVDESQLRRGKLTANLKWGNKPSILVGDFLLSQAFRLMVETGFIRVLDVLSEASAIISEGEVMQLSLSGDVTIKDDKYFRIIKAKTAALFSAACEVSAIISGKDEVAITDMRELGENIGMAFQMTDDLLDYFADQSKLGKKVGDDFFEGKITLPIIKLYEKATSKDKLLISSIFRADRRDKRALAEIIELMKAYQIEQLIKSETMLFISKASDVLERFADSEAKAIMRSIINSLSERIT